MAKKNKHTTAYLTLALILIAVTVGVLFQQGVIQNVAGQPQLIGSYVYATLSCSPAEPPQRTPDAFYINVNGNKLESYMFAFTPRFSVSISAPPDNAFIPSDKAINYKVCEIANPSVCKETKRVKYSSPRNGLQLSITDIDDSHFVYFQVQDSKASASCILYGYPVTNEACWQTWTSMPQSTYRVTYDSYRLLRSDVFDGGQKYIGETCANPKTTAQQYQLSLVTLSEDSKLNYVQEISKDRLKPNEKWNYITKVVPTFETIETYQGQEAICQNGAMHGLSLIETINGNYKVRDDSKLNAAVECCNNEARPNYKCIDHKWVQNPTNVQCSLIKPCSLADEQIDTTDQTRKTLIKESCVNNVCVASTRKVECASSYACHQGFACVNYKCVDTGALKGDTTLSGGNESTTKSSCKWYDLECKSIKEIAGIIVAIIVGIFSWLFFYDRLEKTIKETTIRAIITMLIGALLGFAVGYFAYRVFWTAIIIGGIWIIFTSLFTIRKKEIGF